MKKILLILFLLPFISKAQQSPPAYYNPFDSTLNITQFISGNVTFKKDAPIYKIQRLPGRGDSVFARQGGAWVFQFKDSTGGGGSVSFGTTTQIPFMNSGGTDFIYSSDFIFNNTLKRFAIGLPSGSPLAKISAYSTTGLDTLLYLKQNGGGALLSMMVEANGDWWGNGYNVWRGSTAAFTGEIGNFNTRVTTPAITIPGGGSSLIINGGGSTAGVGVGGSANSVALLDLQSTTKGAILPKMTSTQRTAITPVAGLLVFDTDTASLFQYNGSAWQNLYNSGGGGGGGVSSVSGTTNRITSTGGATPVIDISASYVGQTSITTLGTVTTGTIGTGAIIGTPTMTLGSDATGDIYYRNSGGLLTRLPIGTSAQTLHVVAGLPAWRDTAVAGGGGGSPAGNYGNLQFNRNGAFAAAGSDSLDYENATGLTIKNNLNVNRSGQATASILTIEHTTGSEQAQLRIVSNAGVWRFMNGGSSSGFAGSLSLREENYAQNPIIFRSGADGGGVAIGWNSSLHSGANATLYVTGAAVGINHSNTTPTAALWLPAGTATASTAPLKFVTGTALTTPEDGAMEYHSSHLYFTIGSTRYQLDQQGGGGGTPAGNFGNVQINRNSLFTTPASDSLNFSAGLSIKGTLTATSLASGAITDSVVVITTAGLFKKVAPNVISGDADTLHVVTAPTDFYASAYSPRATLINLKADKIVANGITVAPVTTDTTRFWTITTPISSLTAATATNTINNVAYAQEWQWNSLAGGTGLALTSTSTAAASNTQTLFKVDLSGANATSSQTTNAASFINTHSGTSSTNIAGKFDASGGTDNYGIYATTGVGTNGVAGYFAAGESDNSYAIIAASGRVGLGVTTPNSTVQIQGSFANTVTTTNSSLTLGIANHVLIVTATGQTITLPTAVGIEGRVYTIKLTASGSATIATTSSQTVDGSTTYSLASQYKYCTVISNGANWNVIANN